ncbi:C-C motif chemokine 25-like [Mustelus asterias]
MRFQLLTLALMAACFSLSTSQGNSFEDCCLKYYHVKHPTRLQRHIINYREQTTGGSCNLHAYVVELRRATICLNPNEPWVKKYVKRNGKHRRKCSDFPKSCKRQYKH